MAFQAFPQINLQLTADGNQIKVPGELDFKMLDFVVDSCSAITVIALESVPASLRDKIDTEICFPVNMGHYGISRGMVGQLKNVSIILGNNPYTVLNNVFISVMRKAPFSILGMDVLVRYGAELHLYPQPFLLFTKTKQDHPNDGKHPKYMPTSNFHITCGIIDYNKYMPEHC